MLAAAAAIICVRYNLFPRGKLLIVKRKMKFLRKYCNSENGLRKLLADAANLECNIIIFFWPSVDILLLLLLLLLFYLFIYYYYYY